VPRIVPFPHPALRYESRPVTTIDDELRATVRAMFDLMYASRGIGLAANQVAVPFRFFILNVTADPAQRDQEQVFINPEIVKRHSSVEDEEGCLSFPGLYAKVPRARKIRVKAFDLNGQEIDLEAEDLLSRAIQHETDHLSGRLFIDYLGPLAKHSVKGKLREFEASYRKAQAAGEFLDDDAAVRTLDSLTMPSLELAQLGIVTPPPPPPEAEPPAEPAAGAGAAAAHGPVV
jgi:peptide deformylase